MSDTSIRSALIKGSTWMVTLHWVEHGLAAVSTVVLARLLAPADFGLISMAMLFITLLEVFTTFGVDYALIQRQTVDRDDYDTAWSVRLLQYTALAAIAFACAPLMAAFFEDARVTALMMMLSGSALLKGFENIGTVDFRKSLTFHLEFCYRVAIKLSGFVTTVVLAVALRSYWALAWGIIVTTAAMVVLSYWMHEYRPRFTLCRAANIWSFSKWMIVHSVGSYLRRRGPSIVIGRTFDADTLGFYTIAVDIAQLPTTAIVQPVSRALFPGYAKVANDIEELRLLYLQTLGLQAMVVLPASFGLAAISEALVHTALGEKWLSSAPILSWLAIFYGTATLSFSVQPLLVAMGQMRTAAKLVWFQALLILPAVVYAANSIDIAAVAWIQLLMGIAIFPIQFVALRASLRISWSDLHRQLWRPLLASSGMLVVLKFGVCLETLAPVARLCLQLTIGAASYCLVVMALWRLSGSPAGSETNLMKFVKSKLESSL